MQLQLSPLAVSILSQLRQAGYEAYIVGGAVRDLLLRPSQPLVDYDFTTNATPEQIQAVFPESFYENNFGTVSITHQHLLAALGLPSDTLTALPTVTRPNRIIDLAAATKIHSSLQTQGDPAPVVDSSHLTYQITTFRSDEVYDDFRRPTSLTWGKSLDEDLARRDFTINALALQVNDDALQHLADTNGFAQAEGITLHTSAFTIIDRYHGQVDLDQHLIQAVGNPDQRFKEDALRMLRAIRFAVQLNFEIAEETFTAIMRQAELLQHISGERVRDELLKMLASDYPAEAIELLDETHLLDYIMPELQQGKGVQQGGHHTTDVWVHSLDALRHCPSPDPLVRLATLVHDIGKPVTAHQQGSTITFYNHEVVGARIAKQIGQRLRLSKKEIERLFILVRQHMFYYQPHNTDAAIRRFMRKVGLHNIDDILDVREGDRLGSGARKTSWRLEEMKQRMIEQLNQPMEIKDLAINGNDLMSELNLTPGPQLGRILQSLFQEVLEQPELNTREQLLPKAKALANLLP